MWPANRCAAKPREIASPDKPGSQCPFFNLTFLKIKRLPHPEKKLHHSIFGV
jgi:hypothetical protein